MRKLYCFNILIALLYTIKLHMNNLTIDFTSDNLFFKRRLINQIWIIHIFSVSAIKSIPISIQMPGNIRITNQILGVYA